MKKANVFKGKEGRREAERKKKRRGVFVSVTNPLLYTIDGYICICRL